MDESHQLSVENALRSLHTAPDGLTAAEGPAAGGVRPEPGRAAGRHPTGDPVPPHPDPLLRPDPWVAAGLAFLAAYLDPAGGMAPLGFAIVGVVLLNGAFSFWQEYRAERALAALSELLPRQAKVLRDGDVRTSPPRRSCRVTSSPSRPGTRSRPTAG